MSGDDPTDKGQFQAKIFKKLLKCIIPIQRQTFNYQNFISEKKLSKDKILQFKHNQDLKAKNSTNVTFN